MSNDEHPPADQQSSDFATRKLTDPGATVNLNADELAALQEAQAREETTRKLSDPGATISFRAEDVPGLSTQPAQEQAPPKDPYATVNLSAEEAAQFRSKLPQASAADVTIIGASDIVPPGPPIEGPSMTREIGAPLPVDSQGNVQPSASASSSSALPSPPAYQGYAQQPPSASPPQQGYAQQPPANAAPPAYQGYPPQPREATGPGHPGYPPPKPGLAFGPAQIIIGLGVCLILIALVLALL